MARNDGLLIRGGLVVDGTGARPEAADVRTRGARIEEIGPGLAPAGERVLDASGCYVSPGFIDSHTHLDPSLFWDSSCDPMPQHGVTTALIGNCSLSLAPLRPEHVTGLSDVFCYIEDLPSRSFAEGIPWDWTSYPEFRRRLRERPASLNITDLVGHSPLRLWVMGEAAWERAAGPDEIAAMVDVLDAALADGAFGLSSSTFDRDARGRPVPSVYADDRELAALVDSLARHGRVLEFIPEIRTDQWIDDVDRFARICGPRGVRLTYNGVSCDTDKRGLFSRAIEQAAAFAAEQITVRPQISPRPIDIRVNWSGGMSFNYLPSWHRLVQAPPEEKRTMLASDAWRAAARAEWDTIRSRLIPNTEPERIRLISVERPELSDWVNRDLAQLAAARGQHPSDALADWVVQNDLRPGVMSVAVRNNDTDEVVKGLASPVSLISNSDAGAHVNMFAGAGDSTLLLTTFVRDRADLTVEQAVGELTGKQAAFLGLTDRGVLRPDRRADVTVFALDELTWSDASQESDLPGGGTRLRRPAGGYRYTVVNGAVTQEGGSLTDARPGSLLTAG
jgi:N-acyl-D-amino-acid deacylase